MPNVEFTDEQDEVLQQMFENRVQLEDSIAAYRSELLLAEAALQDILNEADDALKLVSLSRLSSPERTLESLATALENILILAQGDTIERDY